MLVHLVLKGVYQRSKISNPDFSVRDSEKLFIAIHVFPNKDGICPTTDLKKKPIRNIVVYSHRVITLLGFFWKIEASESLVRDGGEKVSAYVPGFPSQSSGPLGSDT